MYRVETHNNSKRYFNGLIIEKNTMHITSNTALSNMIKERARCFEEDKWRVLDIENLITAIYKQWNTTLNQIKFKAEVRKVIVELKEQLKSAEELDELRYFEDNFNILISDIDFVVQTNINNLKYTTESISKRVFSLIYNKLVLSPGFKEISEEILNPIKARSFYRELNGYKEGDGVRRIYFYNINYLDLKRYLVIELLQKAGFEVIFRIPYFKELDRVNICWDMVYGDKGLFGSFEGKEADYIKKPKYVAFLQGEGTLNRNTEESVISKTYREVGDLKRELSGKNIITFVKDSLGSCMNKEMLNEEHCFQTDIGRFLFKVYSTEIIEDDVKMNFSTYRELITSGWMEYRGWNGIKLKEYLTKNEGYFSGCKSIDEIINRINKLKDLEEVNEIFEDQVKLRVKGDEQKKFLSNPFRAFGYNNVERCNVTASYMLEVTLRLKRFILRALATKDTLLEVKDHFELLKLAFRNNHIVKCSKEGSNVEKLTTNKIWGVLNNPTQFGDRLHKDELRDLFSVALKISYDESEKQEERDFSIDQLEGFILRDRMTRDGSRTVIYLGDMSFKSYEKYIENKYIGGKLLNYDDFQDIFLTSLKDDHRKCVMRGVKLQNQSNKAVSSYVKFLMANLFINFNGDKEFSWVEGLRADDSKSILLNQIESIYDLTSDIKDHGLDFEDIIEEKDIRFDTPYYDIKELNKEYTRYSDVAYRDLDFCSKKFLYTTVINSYPMYYSEFHQKLAFAGVISVLKNSMDNSYLNIAKYIFPLFPQWEEVVKSNILTCEYPRKNIRDYKYFDGINYPKTIDSMYLLKSKYLVGENWKIKSRYNKETFKAESYYKEFLQDITSGNDAYSGMHCSMCPHIYICRKGEFLIDNK